MKKIALLCCITMILSIMSSAPVLGAEKNPCDSGAKNYFDPIMKRNFPCDRINIDSGDRKEIIKSFSRVSSTAAQSTLFGKGPGDSTKGFTKRSRSVVVSKTPRNRVQDLERIRTGRGDNYRAVDYLNRHELLDTIGLKETDMFYTPTTKRMIPVRYVSKSRMAEYLKMEDVVEKTFGKNNFVKMMAKLKTIGVEPDKKVTYQRKIHKYRRDRASQKIVKRYSKDKSIVSSKAKVGGRE